MQIILLLLATLVGTRSTDEYELPLKRGESAEIVVHQLGLDVVIEVRSPAGTLLDVVDGPTGNTGDEHVEIIAAESGRYQLKIRRYDPKATSGTYAVEGTLNLLLRQKKETQFDASRASRKPRELPR